MNIQETNQINANNVNNQNPIQAENLKIKNLKYKFFIFIILVLIYIFWWYFLNSFEKVKILNSDLYDLKSNIKIVDTQIIEWNLINNFASNIEKNKKESVNCINNNLQCDILWISWTNIYLKQITKNYLRLNKLIQMKMDFDQKFILRNMIENLLKNSWQLSIINFWMPVLWWDNSNIYILPISISVDFENKEKLLEFLNKIENKVDIWENIYLKIDTLNYNIVDYTKKQTVNIWMTSYFYK